jgi:hypothetical protein
MAKKTKKTDKRERPPTPEETKEASYYARKCGLTKDEALKLIRDAKASIQSPLKP